MNVLEGYKQAEKLLPWNAEHAVLNGEVTPVWINSHSFYYVKESRKNGTYFKDFKKYDCKTGEETDVFDAQTLCDLLNVDCLPFDTCRIDKEGIHFIYNKRNYTFFKDVLKEEGFVETQSCSISPDATKKIIRKQYDLYLVDTQTNQETRITFDGEENNAYGTVAQYSGYVGMMRNGDEPVGALWSPDSRYILTYQLDQRAVKDLYIIESYDEEGRDSIRPRLKTYKCAFPEDKDVPLATFCLYDTKNKTFLHLDMEPMPVGSSVLHPEFSVAKWLPDSSMVYLTNVSRAHKKATFYTVDTKGTVTKVYSESSSTFLNIGTYMELDGAPGYMFSNFLTNDGKTLVWQSERDNLARLFTIDVSTGKEIKAITPEDITVANLLYWDKKYIYFMANCLKDSSDPYYRYPCRVKYDGSDFKVLCSEDGNHTTFTNGSYVVDTWSRVDLPPVTNMYSSDGTKLHELVKADITDLMNRGYVLPERFEVTASDGKTKLYGILVKPAEFDPQKTYPFIDYIYGGMQCTNVPKSFTWKGNIAGREMMGGLEEFAQLGFAGIILDGLGTPMRGKKMHEISYENIHGCAGLKDHVYCLKQLKEKYPFLDLDRAGMWGNSGGGCATSRAMLEYPGVYKVGVSSAGNHDQRMYNESWTEHYYGSYNKDIYLKGENTALAANLIGKLFIVHGAVDDNVAMSQSIRLIDALIKEDKDFDFLILPRTDHNVPANPYFIRKKLDYFVQYLLEKEPPAYRFHKPMV